MWTQGGQFVERGAEIFFRDAFLHARFYVIKIRKQIYFRIVGEKVYIKLTIAEIF